MPQLLAAAANNPPGVTRVINLTSLGHRISPVRFSDCNLTGKEVPDDERNPNPLPPMFAQAAEDGYNGWVAYGQAKTANILFSVGLNERLGGRGVASYAVHPGCEYFCPVEAVCDGDKLTKYSDLDWFGEEFGCGG
jgi:NAD(P)-dependent dehydrogenase (short-subunit alcohol dehydrogenase family)